LLTFFQQIFLKKFPWGPIFATIFCLNFTALVKNSYAGTDIGVGRIRSCEASGQPEGLEFFSTGEKGLKCGDDIEFIFSNPVCLSVAITSYATVKISIATMNKVCGTGSWIPRATPTPYLDAVDLSKASVKAVQKSSQNDHLCSTAVASATSSWLAMVGMLSGIYGIAYNTYEKTKVCGSDWVTPNPQTYDISAPNKKQKVKEAVEDYIRKGEVSKLSLGPSGDKTYREWYYGGEEVEDNPAQGEICYDVTQDKIDGKYPRQKYYMRGTAAGNFNCKKYDLSAGDRDPLKGGTVSAERVLELKSAYDCCKKRSASYICLNYTGLSSTLGGGEFDIDENAIDIDIDKVDIEGDIKISTNNPIEPLKVFCKAGELCTIGGVASASTVTGITFTTKTLDNGALICAETYSLCPYNFAVGGGSEYCDYYQDGIWNSSSGRWKMITQDDVTNGNCASKSEIRNADCSYNEKANKCRNYCQYLTHCTKTSIIKNHYDSNLGSPYFSEACINFTGDSQNKTGYDVGYILNSQKHFSAPIVQCVKETMENLFANVAGHSSCGTENEYPDSQGNCPSGIYKTMDSGLPYKIGNQVKEVSFFSLVQNNLKSAVKIVLTLSIVFYGFNILIGKADIREKKDILMYLLKIALVLYFATGDAWQSMFFKGVYGASSEFSKMVFKIDAHKSEIKRDGCQFGMISQSDGTQISSGRLYPKGKEYLALWDTLDCKIMRYLGYGPEFNIANIASLILASYFSFSIAGVTSTGVGIYFAIALMFFGFFFLAATLRAMHIFLASAMGIILLVFVSPIMITAVLFAKTADLFKKWLAEIISYCLQPMILFAYIALFITIMDKSMVGSATFHGQGPYKTITCDKICLQENGVVKPIISSAIQASGTGASYFNNSLTNCNERGDKIINPMDDSVACLINLEDYGTIEALSMIGVTIPTLRNVFGENGKVKVLTMVKGALIMYLLYKFMSEISGIAARLVGGTELKGGDSDPVAMMKKLQGVLAAIQKRAAGAAKKMGQKGLEKMGSARAAISKAGSQGKKDGSDGDASRGADNSQSSKGGDESGSSSGGDQSNSSKSGDSSSKD
jgi:type IV secretory pathway VirB6-like protein